MKLIKFLTISLVFIGVFFFGSKQVKANAFDQTDISSSTVATNLGAFRFDFGEYATITSLSLKITPNNPTCTLNTPKIDFLLYDGNNPPYGTYYGSQVGQYFDFVNTSTPLYLQSASVWLSWTGVASCTSGSWTGWDYSGAESAGTYWNNLYSTLVPKINVNTLSNPYGASVSIYQPESYSTTTDFSYWINSIEAFGAGTWETGVYYYDISIPTSTTFTDRSTAYSTTTPGSWTANIKINKNYALNPNDTYFAYAYLMKDLTVVATSSITSFGAKDGFKSSFPSTYVPGTINFGTNTPIATLWSNDWCTDTSFEVLGADFGKGICKVFGFLFVPGQDLVNRYTDTIDTMKTRVPFSYAFELGGIIQNVGTGASSSIPTVAIQTSSTSSVPNLNIPLFSSSTVQSATARSGFSTLRTLANILLYIGFGYMAYATAVGMARKGAQK